MKKFALIGSGISHSLSPALFRAAYSGKPYTYDLIDCSNIKDALDQFFSGKYSGANITSPFKQEIIEFCTFTDNSVKDIGATNLILDNGGKLSCYNTDFLGVRDAISKTGVNYESALLVGAGGAARAAAYALNSLKIDFTIANRSVDKAKEIALQYNAGWIGFETIKEELTKRKLIVYTIDNPVSSLDGFDFSDHTIFEANYKSPLFNGKICKKYISGKEWLVCQAVPSFKLFTQIEPELKAMNLVADNS
ncbi:MAG: shikimate dehydrogenase [Bacteroidales bacterium]